VRVSDDVLNCVGFICQTTTRDEYGPKGDANATGFLVSVPAGYRGRYLYFATAKHVAEDLKDCDVHILVNKRGGGTIELVAADPATWFLHPTDETCDVAIVQVIGNPEMDFNSIWIENMLTPETIDELSIGIGDEVYSVGLFAEVENTSKNIPILRHGNISMMPTEQLQTELGYADVHLIEARSIGGMSGSPVFVRPSGKIPVQVGPHGSFEGVLGVRDKTKLLGVIHGHWDVKETDINQYPIVQDRKHGVNYGIAIVVPAIKLIETLNRPDLLEMRMKHDEKMKKRGVPGMDFSKDNDQQTTETGFELPVPSSEQFLGGLNKATRKIEPKK
jgi:hypothetical protein